MEIKQLKLIYLLILLFIFSKVFSVSTSHVLPEYNNINQEVSSYVKGSTVIGYNHLIKAKEWNKYKNGIDVKQATELQQQDLAEAEKLVKYSFKRVKLTQNEYDALTIRAYNAGSKAFDYGKDAKINGSTQVVDYIKKGDTNSKEFTKYYQKLNTYNGKYVPQIEIRRIMELDMFQKNDYTQHSDEYYTKRLIYNRPQAKTTQDQVKNATDKFTSSYPSFYETPSRFIIVIGCSSTDIGCSNVTYYEINKKTKKSFKLTGKTINIGANLSFAGYKFDDKDISYIIYLQSDPALEIIQGSNKLILNEPIFEYTMYPYEF